MIRPNYSVLSVNEGLSSDTVELLRLLKSGIKVILIDQEPTKYPKEFEAFIDSEQLFQYRTRCADKFSVIDGIIVDKDRLGRIAELTPQFNLPQYLVEHCQSTHQIVEASAGTGKTKVMIDRILYLLHTQKDLTPSQIVMITFTNKATNQMNERLQNALVKRYIATGNQIYLTWLEQQSQMRISTIDSFALDLLGQYGTNYGFNSDVSVRSYKHDLDELMKDAMDAEIDSNRPVWMQAGMALYKARQSMLKIWRKLISLGFGPSDILEKDWGTAKDLSKSYQELMLNSLKRLESSYVDLKRKMNSVSIDDTLRDLTEVLKNNPEDVPTLDIKYLFVDEFQDSDNSQIWTICSLAQAFDIHLFVVGDTKQSIYRFRGASDSAFTVFEERMVESGMSDIQKQELALNYRSSPMVIDELNKYFSTFKKEGLLNFDKNAEPFKEFPGTVSFIELKKDEDKNQKLLECIIAAKHSLEDRLNGRKPKTGENVAILVRTNYELAEIEELLKQEKIHAIMKKQGSFYNSEAVRDLYLLISSFVFEGSPTHIFNFLMSPYSGFHGQIDIGFMNDLQNKNEQITPYLQQLLNSTEWKKWDEKFRTQPVLATLQQLIQETEVWNRFAAIQTRKYIQDGWQEEEYKPRVRWETNQYRANLNKMLIILQRNVTGNSATIYKLYSFLKVNVLTNREEEEAELVEDEEEGLIQCMTVHGAKGLEFDTVIMSHTSYSFNKEREEALIVSEDNTHIGWRIKNLENDNYPILLEEERINTRLEETRLLYVALTRTMRNLVCFLAPTKKPDTWSNLLRRCTLNYEVVGPEFNHTWEDIFRRGIQ